MFLNLKFHCNPMNVQAWNTKRTCSCWQEPCYVPFLECWVCFWKVELFLEPLQTQIFSRIQVVFPPATDWNLCPQFKIISWMNVWKNTLFIVLQAPGFIIYPFRTCLDSLLIMNNCILISVLHISFQMRYCWTLCWTLYLAEYMYTVHFFK